MTKQTQKRFQQLISHGKEYGFIFPSSEIYDGLGAVYDYGPYGVLLKRNIQNYWWRAMVQMHENIAGLDAAIFMHPKTWQASGHVEQFNDPLIDNKESKQRYRADELIEQKIDQYRRKGKADKADRLEEAMTQCLEKEDLKGLRQLIEDYGIACPVSGSKNWTEVRQFNLMFDTQLGSVSEDSGKLYLRPETAQGIFVDFLNVQKTTRMKLPFGIAQMGKAFRNEIVARQFLFRMREFEQLEMEFFVRPGEEDRWYDYWTKERMRWYTNMGIPEDKLQARDHAKLSHYEKAGLDIAYEYPIGSKEVEGVHSRTDYDLSRHQKYAGKKLQYFDPELDKSYVPYVVETSAGLDRLFLMLLSEGYTDEELDSGKRRTVLRLHPALAPIKVAIFPLLRKDGLPEKARAVMNTLKLDYACDYEEKDSIGKRYRRHDAIGTPYCITVDHDTLKDDTVTIRYRDSMKQERVAVNKLPDIISEKVNIKTLLKSLAQ